MIGGTSKDEDGKTINYMVKDVFPSYKSGAKDFAQFVRAGINYPPRAKNMHVSGTVNVAFTVEKDGSITQVRVSKSVDPDLDAEAIRVVSKSPKWNPGLERGLPVKSAFVFPVIFLR